MPTKERWARMSTEEKQTYAVRTKEHQQKNREYWRTKNNAWYAKVSEGLVSRRNVLTRTIEDKKERARMKALLRCTRAKQARFSDELTLFVTKEAHTLRILRNKITGIEWHVDHVVPLKGKLVSGLHIWSNLAVIPKVDNLRKGNKNSIHEKWPEGL
jgi:5-methylcytosine-specific restriction endonuclease McrA